jgi:hypothetical protein
MADFAEYLTRTEHLLIVCAVWVSIGTVNRVFPDLTENPTWARLLPIIPLIFCSAVVWVPGAVEGKPLTRIMLGLVLGAMAAHGHKILKQSIFGNDRRIRDHPPRL